MEIQETSLHFAHALLPGGWEKNVRISTANGTCSRIEVGVQAKSTDERFDLVIPGMPNLHSHAFQRGMAGLAELRGPTDDSFWTWRDVMYRFVDQIGPGELEAIASLAFVEMLEAGFTRVGEFHYLHHDQDGRAFADPAEMSGAIVSAASLTGIGLTLLPVFYAHSAFGGVAPTDGQRRFVCDVDQFLRLVDSIGRHLRHLPDPVLGMAPHSLRAVSPDQLRSLLLARPSGPVHIHIAEQTKEVDDCIAHFGARPVEWLTNNAPVDQNWCLVHATHITDEEARAIATSSAVVGLCPITEANLGDGLFNFSPYLSAGGRFGIGSDSNVLIDCAEELRLLEYGQRLSRRARNVLATNGAPNTGAAIFREALRGGCQALGATSGIRVGSSLDIVTLNSAHPSLAHRSADQSLDSWIFAVSQTAIESVWRCGTRVVTDGRHHSRSVIEERFTAALGKILS